MNTSNKDIIRNNIVIMTIFNQTIISHSIIFFEKKILNDYI